MPAELVERFRESGVVGSVGLSGMGERLRDVGGQLRIESAPSGTTVIATVPVKNEG
jgi:signal transduction histidine kinase